MLQLRLGKSGFTLIELLVVISIIGMLSAIVLASLNSARYKANDAKRHADLNALRTALELYYNTNGSYPSTSGQLYGVYAPAVVQSATNWIPGLVSGGHIATLPNDPQLSTSPSTLQPTCGAWPSMYFYYSANGSGYKLVAHCPSNSSVVNGNAADGHYDPIRPTWAWQVCSGSDCGI